MGLRVGGPFACLVKVRSGRTAEKALGMRDPEHFRGKTGEALCLNHTCMQERLGR